MTTHEPGATDAQPVEQGRPKARALELLREALKIVDLEAIPLEIGARLDHVICSLEDIEE